MVVGAEQSNGLKLGEEQEQQAIALYKYVKELSRLKYESELRREDSLIQQSSNMQTAFSFMTATVFMALPIMLEYRRSLSIHFFFVAVSTIMFFLLVSLVTASFAQRRVKREALMSIDDMEKYILVNWNTVLTESQQLKQWVKVMGRVQKSLAKTNEKRISKIRISMYSFFMSIAMGVFWYIVACKIL